MRKPAFLQDLEEDQQPSQTANEESHEDPWAFAGEDAEAPTNEDDA